MKRIFKVKIDEKNVEEMAKNQFLNDIRYNCKGNSFIDKENGEIIHTLDIDIPKEKEITFINTLNSNYGIR